MSDMTSVVGSATQILIDGAAITSLQSKFRGELLVPGGAEYDAARRLWNAMVDKHPALIARCRGASDVIAAVNFDRSGTTRIGKYVLNHSFMLPGLVSTIVAVTTGLIIGKLFF